MTISVRSSDTATILDMNGALKIGDAEQGFREKVRDLLAAGSKNLGLALVGSAGVLKAGTSCK